MVHQVNKLRKSGGAYVTHDELAEILEPYRTALGLLEDASTDHDEKITRIEGALEIDDLNAAIDELDGLADSGEPTGRLEPAADEDPQDPAESTKEALSGSDKEAHPAESDPEGRELVAKIHEKKSRAKRKPEGQDPLGLVPDPEGDDS